MVITGVARSGSEVSKTARNTSWRPAKTGGLVPQDGLKGLVELGSVGVSGSGVKCGWECVSAHWHYGRRSCRLRIRCRTCLSRKQTSRRMTLRQYVVTFGCLGLFMGSLGALQLYIMTDGHIVGSLIALLSGLSLGLLAGVYRVLQLRSASNGRERAESLMSYTSVRTKWSLESVVLIILGCLPIIAAALHASAIVKGILLIPPLVALGVQVTRSRSH